MVIALIAVGEIVMTQDNPGAALLRVQRHHDLPDDGQRDHHRKGWELYLSRLELRICGGDPGPDPNT